MLRQLCPILFPWAVAHQAPLSMGFSRQEYWSGLPFPFPGDLPNQGSNLHLLCLLYWQAGYLLLSYQESQDGGEVLKSEPVQVLEFRIVFPLHWDRI